MALLDFLERWSSMAFSRSLTPQGTARSGQQAVPLHELLMDDEENLDTPTQRSPLLQASDSTPGRASFDSTAALPQVYGSHKIVNLLCIIVFFASSADGFSSIPLTQLIEDAACREHYKFDSSAGSVEFDPEMCKDRAIQSRVAFIFAVSGTLDALVWFFAALPWGTVADKIGRKPVASLALLGGALGSIWWIFVLLLGQMVPLSIGWFASAGYLIGGGYSVFLATIFSIIADVSSDETRAVFFMRVHVASMVGMLVSPTLSSILMNVTGPWPVMWVGVVCLLIGAAGFLFIPETVHKKPVVVAHHGSGIKVHLAQTIRNLRETLSILESRSLVMLFTASFLTQPVLVATLQFLVQFISKRYTIELKDTGYVQTAYGLVHAFQAFVGLPLISRYLMAPKNTRGWKHRFLYMRTDRERDYFLARWSYFILIPGLVILGLAPSLGVFLLGLLVLGIGSGFASYNRSLMSLFVEKELQTRLYSLSLMVEVVATIYSGPLLAALFSKGMDLGGVGIGLPYFVPAAMVAASLVPLFFVRLPKVDKQTEVDDEDD